MTEFNEKELLILQFNTAFNGWQDVTTKIQWYKAENNACRVKYVNNDTFYYKSWEDIKIKSNPKKIDFTNCIVFHENHELSDISEMLQFDNWYKIFYISGTTGVYEQKKLILRKNVSNQKDVKSLMDYLTQISSLLSNGESKDFLYNQLKNITVLENSFLSKFIEGKLDKVQDNKPIIYPFNTNQSQKNAVEKALHNELSLIQGPPGTGKTQTILNIVANFVIREKSVAVLSGNNEATKNVEEKLAKEGFGAINAVLGKTDNVNEFFNKPNTVLNKSDKTNCIKELSSLEEKSKTLDNVLQAKLDLAKTNQSLHEYEVEKSYHDEKYNASNHTISKVLEKLSFTSKKLLELAGTLELLPKNKITGLFNRIRFLLKFGIIRVKDIADNQDDSIEYLKNKFYSVKIKELNEDKKNKSEFLENNGYQNLIDECIQLSKVIFSNSINNILASYGMAKFSKDDYKNDFSKFVKRYPVVYSTTNAIASCSGKGYFYDCVIIDESSQVDLVTAILAFSMAKQVVLVGDKMQITNVVDSSLCVKAKQSFVSSGLPEYYDYTKNNVLQCITTRFPNAACTLLNEHYRCDPQIIGFCNKRFYNNQLVIQTSHTEGHGIIFFKHEPHYKKGRTNQGDIESIKKDVTPLLLESSSVGVIAPYRDQVALLKKNYANEGYTIDTIHKFQGKEADNIILSTVVDKIKFYEDEEKIDFLNTPNLLNVAISRAKKKLFVLVSKNILNQNGSILKDLSDYNDYYGSGPKIISSSVYSVFDLMYDDYAPILETLNKQLLHESKNKSEDIIYTIIDKLCREGKYGALDYKFEYPLKEFIKPQFMETEEERRFVLKCHSHCDFAISSALNKKILLLVEVDGLQHDREPQKSNDIKKDRLLARAGFKLLRLPTRSFNCEEKIIQALMEAEH